MVNVQVTNAEGAGLPAELGIAIVDESAFTPTEHDPNVAKLTFLLEEALLAPQYRTGRRGATRYDRNGAGG